MDRKIASDVEFILQDQAVLQHLQKLVDVGCDRNELVTLLDLSFMADDSWNTLVGMNLTQLKAALRQIEDCAQVIERLNRTSLMHDLAIEQRNPIFRDIHDSPTIPERLREYAANLDDLRTVHGPGRRARHHSWKAWIVASVLESTQKPYDLEVSSLVAAVLEDVGYSSDAHKTWRLKYRDLVEKTRTRVQMRRHKLAIPPRC